jgi:hypothetical protein
VQLSAARIPLDMVFVKVYLLPSLNKGSMKEANREGW